MSVKFQLKKDAYIKKELLVSAILHIFGNFLFLYLEEMAKDFLCF